MEILMGGLGTHRRICDVILNQIWTFYFYVNKWKKEEGIRETLLFYL